VTRHFARLFTTGCCLVTIVAHANAQGAHASDVAAIRAARIAQNAAMAAGDPERVATFWTDDVDIRRGLGAHVSGKAGYMAIQERAPLADTMLVYQRITQDVTVSGHWPLAFETGTWTAKAGGKGPALITGRYSAQWVKRDGRWLIRGEVFVALECSGTGCDAVALP
jgi:uncharacterized protein (TIGR02246 family)